MKARDADTVATRAFLMAAMTMRSVATGAGGEVTDEQTVELLTREAKKRTEAVEAYTGAGRTELADKEQRELAIIRRYLPAQMSEAEVAAAVDEAIVETGASGASDLGRVMSAVMPKVKGRADGKLVNRLVRERLS
jgi:uncharacterized protein